MTPSRLLVLGSGYTGSRALRLGRAQGLDVRGTVRSNESAAALRGEGFEIIVAPELDRSIARLVDAHTHVIVAFAPDGHTDARVAAALAGAHSIAYISSTGVYGDRRGRIDRDSPLPELPNERSQRILSAEQCYRALSASVLRSPGIYGPDRGLHMRVLRGEHRIPGDGSRTLSRIHADDLASCALAAAHVEPATFVVGDELPAPHIEVVRFICETYRVPIPDSVPLESVHASLQADRQVDATQSLSTLGVTLRYPSYREGMSPAATGIAPQFA
jgi:nucleoside-diphosphate-sugar epimerase